MATSPTKLESKPRVSVIIPTLNEAENIQRALHRAWSLGPYEIIVADGGSEDQTVALAEPLASRVVQTARGRATQQNAGAAAATGEVLLFLHADNWLHQSGIDQILLALQRPEVHIGGFWQRIEANGLTYRLLERGNGYRVWRWGWAYGDQGIFVRRAFFDSLGGFPEFGLMEDLVLMQRAVKHSRPVLLRGPLHISPRRWQQHGILRQTLRNWALIAAYKMGISPNALASYYYRARRP